MDEIEIEKRVPAEIVDLASSFEMKIVAIWVTDTETEIYCCDVEPDDETVSRLEMLSQSFIE